MGLRQYQVEIKSVNHRYSDVNIKMPRVISYLEEDVKKQILSKISRGKIDVFITYENSSSEANEIKINKEIAKMYIKELKNLAKEENILANIEVTDISKFPAKSTGLIEEYVVKLEERIKELLKTEEIDKTRIAQEVVIYADKCSVQEEVTRLKSHIGQFRNLINTDQAVGKKLDFLIQEMNRETNTIGSKANNLEITNNVIDIKTELENIREQIQNIE